MSGSEFKITTKNFLGGRAMRERDRKWSKGIQAAVCFCFDLDAETLWISRNEENLRRPVTLSQGTFGLKVGTPHILDLLAEYEIRATFFVPAWVVERNEDLIKRIADEGHEIGHHGYRHEWPDMSDPSKEEEILVKGIEIIEKTIGERPYGYRSPAGEYTTSTLSLLKKHDFVYSSTMMDDIFPYKHQINDKASELVELPVHWSIDDAPYFIYSLRPPISRMTITPRDFLEIFEGALLDYYQWGGCFTTFLHPQVIGRPGRFQVLKEFIQFVKGLPHVWVARGVDIARYCQKNF
jgi:peptidoglycan/xylan/chitin deacetylase (PgdA/CDA1 family)